MPLKSQSPTACSHQQCNSLRFCPKLAAGQARRLSKGPRLAATTPSRKQSHHPYLGKQGPAPPFRCRHTSPASPSPPLLLAPPLSALPHRSSFTGPTRLTIRRTYSERSTVAQFLKVDCLSAKFF